MNTTEFQYRYPPDAVLKSVGVPITFTYTAAIAILAAALADILLFGFQKTTVPNNYPFFVDGLLLLFVTVLLRLSHRIFWNIMTELAAIAKFNEKDPLALTEKTDPGDIHRELSNVLFLAYHPVVLLAGALAGGAFVFGAMYALDVFSAYPYLLMNFGFGAAHGVLFGPAIGGSYVLYRSNSEYIVDIDLLDPDGVGGYREIGNGIVKLASHGVILVTLDFVILSSVAFTRFTRFKQVVSVLYLLLLCGSVVWTFGSTFVIRRRLIEVRDRKVARMQTMFYGAENTFWQKYYQNEYAIPEALSILTIYVMFHQMDRMNMWPMNLYSLTRLGSSVAISLTVFLVNDLGVVSLVLP